MNNKIKSSFTLDFSNRKSETFNFWFNENLLSYVDSRFNGSFYRAFLAPGRLFDLLARGYISTNQYRRLNELKNYFFSELDSIISMKFSHA